MNSNIYVGTCGWSYKGDWDKVFYPSSMQSYDYLEFYSKVFKTVEIDSSFYHIPNKEIVERWVETTPLEFKFSAKIPQVLSHNLKVSWDKQMKNSLKQYMYNIGPLEKNKKIFAHLLQLPPSFSYNNRFDPSKLKTFLSYWSQYRMKYGQEIVGEENYSSDSWVLFVEFRNKNWMERDIFTMLYGMNAGYCGVIEPEVPPRMDITRNNEDLFYMRFHGYGKKPWWNYLFSDDELDKWAGKIKNLVNTNPNTKVVLNFNNHFSGNAVKNAQEIMPKLGVTPNANPIDLQKEFMQFKKNNYSLKKWM